MRIALALLVVSSSYAQSASDEPGSSGREEPGAPSDEPTSRDEPSGAAATSGDEPGRSDEPTIAQAPTATTVVQGPANLYGIGVRLRYITLPHWFLGLFTDQSTQLHSLAVAGEFEWLRRGKYTLLSSLEVASYSPADGNYLGKGEDPAIKTDYVQFRGLKMVSVDASFLWQHDFNKTVSFLWGAGLGLMIPIGEVWRATADTGCSGDTAGDEDLCHPSACEGGSCSVSDIETLSGMMDPLGENRDAAFQQDLWPVYPLLNALVGLRFNLSRHFAARVDAGFHNAFFFGAGATYYL
jgi:hypothetical protein